MLFGFAVRHPVTGGLSWTRSTPVAMLRADRARARTGTGRFYELGLEVPHRGVTGLGLEAWIAYDLLLAPSAADAGAVPGISVDRDREWAWAWLVACKAARHLRLPVPGLLPGEAEEFMARHAGAYLQVRSRAGHGP